MGKYLGTVLLAVADEDAPGALAQRLREAGHDALSVPAADALLRLGGPIVDVLVARASACVAPACLAERARRRDPDIEIVVAGGPADFEDALACLRAGASDVVGLPLEGEALLSAVTRALERRRSRGLANELLRAARSTGLGQLTGSIAHEIANPVSILTASIDAASQSLATLAELRRLVPMEAGQIEAWWKRAGRQALEQANEVMAEANEGAQRLKLLARDLRGMLRSDPEATSDFDVGDAIQAAIRVTRAELTSHARLVVEAPSLLVRASRGALTEALVHVLVRAAQAITAGGRRRGHVAVRVRLEGGTVLLEVEDDAAAAPEEGTARNLAPYLPPGTPAGPGLLGLAVARDLVERQGGSLQARPRPGGGTIFEVKLRASTRVARAAGR